MAVNTPAKVCALASSLAPLAFWLLATTATVAAPAIRTSAGNRVPQCVTPERLMAFLKVRNPDVDPKYRDIARWYKHYGEAWHVRWDYAFFQMAIETNYLKFHRGDGSRGDVSARQNNFAGLGATGGGAAGENFADLRTGVHAQIQHLVAYSGERVEGPVARRTDENQDSIIEKSRRLRREVTFADLARRWAADRGYGKSIDFVADQYRQSYCNGRIAPELEAAALREAKLRVADASGRIVPAAIGKAMPTPQRLAGPETFSWDDATGNAGAAAAQPAETPPAGAPETGKAPAEDAPRVKPPVRTIWSRKKGPEAEPASVPQPKPAEPRRTKPEQTAARPKPHKAAVPELQVQAPPPEPASITPGPEAAAAAPRAPESDPPDGTPGMTPGVANAEPQPLPTFRIAPAQSPPSHLGGPLLSPPAPVPATRKAAAAAAPAPAAPASSTTPACRVLTASYGGKKTLLVRALEGNEVHLTALTVLDGFEKTMFDTYAKTNAPDAELIGEFPTKDAAVSEANALCLKP